MARFLVLRDTFISTTGRLARAGEEVEFDIPEVKDLNGKLVQMTIGDNLERLDKPVKVKAEKTEKTEKAEKGTDLA